MTAFAVVPWSDWATAITAGVTCVSDRDLARAAAVIRAAEVVLTAGNGGSASLASHMAQAVSKPDYAPGGGHAAVCLTDHTPLLTAHANDGGWASAMAESARPFLSGPHRVVLVAFSSSGRSENVVRLARLAREHGRDVVAFTGFDGEPLRSLATVSLHVDSRNYEVVEPVHDALLHRVQAHLRAKGS